MRKSAPTLRRSMMFKRRTPASSVSNAAPYRWYTGDMTTELSPGDAGVLIRIKAGPASGSLVVNRVELCLEAL